MPTLKQAAVITLFASVSTTSTVGGGKASLYASAVPLNQHAKAANTLDLSSPTDLSLVLTEQQVAAGQKAVASLDQQSAAKWGFLKNIVNIDRFFASGPEPTPSGGATFSQTKKDNSIVPQSLTKKKAPAKKMTKLSQLHSKRQYSQLETEIAGGITDDTATAAAEQALMEAANTMTEQHQDEVPAQPTYDGSDDAAAQTGDESTDQQVAEAAAALAAAQEAITKETAGKEVSKEVQQEIDNAQEALAAEAMRLIQQTEADKKQKTAVAQAAAPESTGEEISDLPTKEAKEAHAASVREEGLKQIDEAKNNDKEIDLEIEAPGAANKVAEEGASIITSQEDFQRLSQELLAGRKNDDNKIGKGGFQINFVNPQTFDDSMTVVVFNDNTGTFDESQMKEERFNTQDPEQAKTASMAMAMTLQTEAGATIVDDQPGKESIIQNMNSDQSKLLSQISSGYAIRKDYVQKMAPGDKQFHMISWDESKKSNNMKTFQSRKEGDEAYAALGSIPKILVSGETGDILLANGEQNMIDQAVGMFYTQRYQGKYYGMP